MAQTNGTRELYLERRYTAIDFVDARRHVTACGDGVVGFDPLQREAVSAERSRCDAGSGVRLIEREREMAAVAHAKACWLFQRCCVLGKARHGVICATQTRFAVHIQVEVIEALPHHERSPVLISKVHGRDRGSVPAGL